MKSLKKIQHILQLPPYEIVRWFVGYSSRKLKRHISPVFDIFITSYGSAAHSNPDARIAIAATDISPDLVRTLQTLGKSYLQHRFDILGSGRISPVYRFEASGFVHHRYAPAGPSAPDTAGHGLEAVVNRVNLARSREIWRLIDHSSYTPIDWQIDVRSGFRWRSKRHSYRQPIPIDSGADVKLPWELGRLQHLPQLALCAVLAREQMSGFEPAEKYLLEISNQLLDFIAANPPRFGVNWMGAMDAGIRGANISLTLALLAGAGLQLDAPVEAVVLSSLRDHAVFVATHLEYSESGRSNHYIANIAGLLWIAWALSGEQADQWAAFAISQILHEADAQFLADGGNYEGSTSYHRLSAEMIVFSLALILSYDKDVLGRIESVRPPRQRWRAAFPALPFPRYAGGAGAAAIIPPSVRNKLLGAAVLSHAVQGADGTIVQIGDTDSGRFFKLHPVGQRVADERDFRENDLDHRGLCDSIEVLFGRRQDNQRLEATVVRSLIRESLEASISSPNEIPDFGDLASLMEKTGNGSVDSRCRRELSFGKPLDPQGWTRLAFSQFGLFIFRHREGALLTFRCAEAPPDQAPRGHLHDDNLSIEYRFGGLERRDSGSFVYTPSIELRNRYRSAAAHDAPRVQGQPVAIPDDNLFDLRIHAFAKCLAFRPDGVAGEISGPWGSLMRVIQITPLHVVVSDYVDPPAVLSDIVASPELSTGYGRQ